MLLSVILCHPLSPSVTLCSLLRFVSLYFSLLLSDAYFIEFPITKGDGYEGGQ